GPAPARRRQRPAHRDRRAVPARARRARGRPPARARGARSERGRAPRAPSEERAPEPRGGARGAGRAAPGRLRAARSPARTRAGGGAVRGARAALGGAAELPRSLAMRVLIADDDAISRRILSASLTRFGHTVDVASDDSSAWAGLSGEAPPELVILDWQMPGIDGPELCRRLRQRPAASYTYVILITSNGSPQLAAEGLEAGADDFLIKPFDREELRVRVRAGERILQLQAEKERARAHLEAVVSNLDCAVLLIDPDGHVVYGNPALASLSGVPLDAALQLTRQDFARRDDERRSEPDALIERMAMVGALPLDVEVDVEVRRPERRMLRWMAKQVALPEGPGELDIVRDVTAEIERDREQATLARVDHLTGLH